MKTTTTAVAIPDYLRNVYNWAYLHPRSVRLFEQQWIINLILFGNYKRLSNVVIDLIEQQPSAPILQVACVYGNLTQRISHCHEGKSRLDVVDIAPIQLANLRRKIGSKRVGLLLNDSTNLNIADDSYQQTLLFFLLHEQPLKERIETLKEAIRVTRPGGQVIIVDYHRPHYYSPFRHILPLMLNKLEPFARDLFRHQIQQWLPRWIPQENIEKKIYFSGLYQSLVITIPA